MSKKKKLIEAAVVVAVSAAAFAVARKLGVQERGNTLLGGEVCIPVLVAGLWYGVKAVIRDIREGVLSDD